MPDLFPPATRFDLHLHSLRSDGRYEPGEVLLRCARGGLDVVALTDHDLPTEMPLGRVQIEGRSLLVLAGAELSGMHAGSEQHLLVYFPGSVPEGFRSFCAQQCVARAQRYAAAIERLGMPDLDAPSCAAQQGEMALTRHHLARQLVLRGHVSNIREAFARFLSDSHHIVPPIEISFLSALEIARSFGGITSWAHPQLALLQDHLPTFATAGLHAVEGLRPQLSSADRRKYRNAARRYGLSLTGGSDWHGWGDDTALGLFRVEAREMSDFITYLQAA